MERKSTIEFYDPKSNIRLQEARRTLKRLTSETNTQANLANTLKSPSSLKIAKSRARLLQNQWIANSSEAITATVSPTESPINPNGENTWQIDDGDSGSSTTRRITVPLAEEANMKTKKMLITTDAVSSPYNSKFCKWISYISSVNLRRFFLRLLILLHIGAFVLIRIVYGELFDQERFATFNKWAAYFHLFPSISMCVFVHTIFGAFITRRTELRRRIPQTSLPVELFSDALRKDIPGQQEKLKEFAYYILLMWLRFMPDLSPDLVQEANFTYIQHALHISESQMEDIKKESKFVSSANRVYERLKALVEDAENMSMFKARGKSDKIIDASICSLSRSCMSVQDLLKETLFPEPIFSIFSYAIHLCGWIVVSGYYSDNAEMYFPSYFCIIYYPFGLLYDISSINVCWLDFCNIDTKKDLDKEIEDCKRFVEGAKWWKMPVTMGN